MNWTEIKSKKDLPKSYGWYAVAVNPVNQDDYKDRPTDMNSWRESFGFNIGWFNGDGFYEARFHGDGAEDITKRVTHWAERPTVPILHNIKQS